jgi:predicted nuclease of predicted toxin-antitoxin system
MNFLVDHNLRGHAVLLSGSILSGGWLDWVSIRFITFDEMKLPINSDDRVVWQLAQSNQMILLTANRSMKGENSLEQVMREEITPKSLPVITIGNADRLLNDPEYRERCAIRLVEIVLDIDGYRGVSRLFIP